MSRSTTTSPEDPAVSVLAHLLPTRPFFREFFFRYTYLFSSGRCTVMHLLLRFISDDAVPCFHCRLLLAFFIRVTFPRFFRAYLFSAFSSSLPHC